MIATADRVIAVLALGVAAAGCGGADEGAAGSAGAEDPGEHACEHVDVAGAAVTASADRDAAPEITLSEEPYTVTMPADGTTGYVKVQGPTQALLFTREVGEVTGLYVGPGTDSILPQGSPNEYCPNDIAEHFHLDLELQEGYAIRLTSAMDTVWLLLIGSAGHTHAG
jgi:hypothetical protein